MSTFNLRRFADPDTLKTIRLQYLIQLLDRYKDYFLRRGLNLSTSEDEGFDYEKLAAILVDPDDSVPPELIDALHYINEMSDEGSMEELITGIEELGLSINTDQDQSPADVAVQVWLLAPDLLEHKHAERLVLSKQSFEYFQADKSDVRIKPKLDDSTIASLINSLDDWFISKRRGRGTKVFVFDRKDEVWFLVRHGQAFRREGSIVDGKSESIFYRPEKHDILVYDKKLAELRINVDNKGIKETYLRLFGRYLFSNEDHFPGIDKYNLEPLRTDGEDSLICSDVPGIEWIRLKEIRYFWGGTGKEVEIRKAIDIFEAYADRDSKIPERVRIIHASFDVKFENIRATRSLTIKPRNIARFTRDEDSYCLNEWLEKRGFITAIETEEEEEYDETLVRT